MNPHIRLILMPTLCFLAFSFSLYAQPNPSDTPGVEPKKYDVAGISYSKDSDMLRVAVSFAESASGKVSEGSTENVVICAKNSGDSKYRVVLGSEGNSDNALPATFYSIETGVQQGPVFKLKPNWEVFYYHLEVSSERQCKFDNLRDPVGYDIQYIRNFDLSKPQLTLSPAHKWVATGNNGVFSTKNLEIGLNSTLCTKVKVELRSGQTVFADTETVLCPSAQPTAVKLAMKPQFRNSLIPNQPNGTYKLWVNGEEFETLALSNPLEEFGVSSSEFYQDNKKVEPVGPIYIVNQKDGEKRLEISATTGGNLDLIKPDCAQVTKSNLSNLFVFKITTAQCDSSEVLSFGLKGEGNSGQPLVDNDKRYFVKIDNKTDFVGPVSFSQKTDQTVFRYELNRQVAHRIDVQAILPGGNKELGVFSTMAPGQMIGGAYEQGFSETFLNLLQSTEAVSKELKEGRTVPILFKFTDISSDGDGRVFGQFQVSAYGVNRSELKSILEKKEKLPPMQANEAAKRLLGLENVPQPTPEQSAVLADLIQMLTKENPEKRNKTIGILKIFGNVGLRLLGVPVTL